MKIQVKVMLCLEAVETLLGFIRFDCVLWLLFNKETQVQKKSPNLNVRSTRNFWTLLVCSREYVRRIRIVKRISRTLAWPLELSLCGDWG